MYSRVDVEREERRARGERTVSSRWPGSEVEWPQCWRRAPSSEKRSRGAASKGAARRGDEAADVLMLLGVLGALSLSLQRRIHCLSRLRCVMGEGPLQSCRIQDTQESEAMRGSRQHRQ